MGYDGALLLAEALGQGGGTGRPPAEAMRERIPRLKNFAGATGVFQFTRSVEVRRKVPLLKVELGNFVPVLE
jgi:ABC-type branched-subunit amino acid transport system substrate-binding protein